MNKVQVSAIVLLFLFVALELIFVLTRCGGHFVYSLDDPYIHLAVASNILKGTYGVNVSEASSPSSSVIWPWILALFLRLGVGAISAFLIDLAASVASVLLLGRMVVRLFPSAANASYATAAMIALAIVFATSSVALPFTGLEHSLHVVVCILLCDGLMEVARGRAMPVAACIALAVMPLVRFEGIAFAMAALVVLLATPQWRRALASLAGMVAGLALYAVFVARNHLPFLPSSVTLKSNVLSGGLHGIIKIIVMVNVLGNMLILERAVLLNFALLTCVLFLVLRSRGTKHFVVLVPISVAVAAQIMAGAYGWFGRYEVYAMVIATIGVLYVLSNLQTTGLQIIHPLVRTSFAALLLLQLCLPYMKTAWSTSEASYVIYMQQYQMAIFAKNFYKAAVGVNDLGLVSYQNPSFVLDLFGLGSEEVRKLKKAGAYTPARMDELVRRHDVGLVMVYTAWFGGLPADWKPVARLATPMEGSSVYNQVTFFATPEGDVNAITAELKAFQPQLPVGDTIEFVAAK